jgi:hypothetical protein
MLACFRYFSDFHFQDGISFHKMFLEDRNGSKGDAEPMHISGELIIILVLFILLVIVLMITI